MRKITDFKIAYHILLSLCDAMDIPFLDLPVITGDIDEITLKQDSLCIGRPKELGQAINNIVLLYIEKLDELYDSEFDIKSVCASGVSTVITTLLRRLSYQPFGPARGAFEDLVAQRLYQHRFGWLAMSDVICPAFGIPVKNHSVVRCSSPLVDISVFVPPSDDEKNKEGTVFLNVGIEYKPCSDAALLVSSLECHDASPNDIVLQILTSNIFHQLNGLCKLHYNSDADIEDFFDFLIMFSGAKAETTKIIEKDATTFASDSKMMYKRTQGSLTRTDTPWWFYGLLERMLQPVRGSDWTTYERLEPYVKDVWDRVEKERQRRGLTGLSYEALLRVVGGDNEGEEPQTLEALLGSNRVW